MTREGRLKVAARVGSQQNLERAQSLFKIQNFFSLGYLSFDFLKLIRALISFLLLSGITIPSVSTRADITSASKIFVRTRIGQAKNLTNDRKNPLLGGFGILAHFFLWPWLSTGVGYHADFDPKLGLVPFQGLLIQGRFYFLGTGSHHEQGLNQHDDFRKFHSTFAFYGVGEFTKGSYNLIANAELQNGNYTLIGGGVGSDYRLNRHLELNLELTQTLMGLSSDPQVVRPSLRVVTFGLGYIF